MDAGRPRLWGHLVGFLLLAAWAPFDPAAPALSAMGAGVGAGLFGLGGLFFLYTGLARGRAAVVAPTAAVVGAVRSEEHTSELQSRENLVCRLLLEKKKEDRHLAELSTLQDG